ncbi:MAG TPA: 50S ribosomal protein L11 methyltransferase, partial [Candidatus Polarisedimenticolia bacterium]|nr:50S ribosomal protein L11 methyltransferase [Candidatus Polarisedimenticolia bacterium]
MTSWLKLTIASTPSLEEEIAACLHEGGTIGVESREGRLDAYFPEPLDVEALLVRLRTCLSRAGARLDVLSRESIEDGLWHERWMESLQPFAVGERFLIAPGLAAPSPHTGRIVIRLTPGRAFGTGEHP